MDEIRVVLLGKTGSGKSSFGNTLLGEEVFDSERGLSSGTKKCNWVRRKINGIKPSGKAFYECRTHLLSFAAVPFLTPCGVRYTFPIVGTMVVSSLSYTGLRRITKQDPPSKLFGMLHRFRMTRSDGMQQELNKQIKRASEDLKEVLCDAYNRYYVVDNRGTKEQRKQHASFLLAKIQELIRKNGNTYFNDMVDKYKKVQEIINRHQKVHSLSNEEADKEAREAIVEEEEGVGFFDTVKTIAKDYILPVVGSLSTGAMYGVVAKRCSVM